MDDPGILLPGQWEIITAGTYASSGVVDAAQAPLLDVSLGIIDDYVQISLGVPWEHVSPAAGPSNSGLGNAQLGVKWRFFNGERLQLALAPYRVFGVSGSTAAKGIGTDSDISVLPVLMQYQLSDAWTLNGELAYASVRDGENAWGYGAALAFTQSRQLTWLLEAYGSAATGFDNQSVELRAGLDLAIRDDLHLLFSAGTGLDAPSEQDELDAAFYLGVQLFR